MLFAVLCQGTDPDVRRRVREALDEPLAAADDDVHLTAAERWLARTGGAPVEGSVTDG